MKAESIAFAVAGMFFGIILGWVGAVQQGAGSAPPAALAQAPAAAPAAAQQGPAPLDEARVQALMTVAQSDPANAGARVQLANAYFDAERFDEAVSWYEQALAIDPTDVNASTDLGVAYYYTNRPDEALQQFEQSLRLDPNHTKTLLNQGIVRAFGKQDLTSAAQSWQRVVEIAPTSPEGQAAQRALDGVAAAHAGDTPTTQEP